MLSKLNIKYIDHFAVTTIDLHGTMVDYLSLPGARLLKGPAENPAQKVHYAFIQQQDGFIIEILSPMKDSPIERHLEQGGSAYHVCYAVENILKAIKIACDNGAKLVQKPKEDYAFDGRCVAFLIHKNHGLFELLEVVPSSNKILDCNHNVCTQSFIENMDLVDDPNLGSDCHDLLINIFKRNFDNLESDSLSKLEMNTCSYWDSLKHMLLFMDIENTFKVSISSEKMTELDSYAKIILFLNKIA